MGISKQQLKDAMSYVTKSLSKIKNKVDDIKQYDKYVNVELDHIECKLNAKWQTVVNQNIPFVKKSGNMTMVDEKIVLKPGRTYEAIFIVAHGGYENGTFFGNTAYSSVNYVAKVNDVIVKSLNPYRGNASEEYPYSMAFQYTNDTAEDQLLSVGVSNINAWDTLSHFFSSFTVKEIGRAITIDPVEYVDTTQGIEDTPVGHIIDIIGETIPKHYLYCNGTVYNIADYPHLAEHIKKEFGIYNYFGGDGTTTFAVPNLVNDDSLVDITPTMTSNTTPSPYVVTGSAPYYADNPAYLAFNNGATTSSFLTVPAGWVQLDFKSSQKVSHFLLQAPSSGDMTIMPKDFTLYGSNDGSSYVELKSYSNESKWSLNEKRVYNLEGVYNYRYYKFKIINNNGSVNYSAINEIRFLLKKVEKVVCIKYEPTYFINIQGLIEETILWEGNIGTGTTTIITDVIKLSNSISNYDKIGVFFEASIGGATRLQYQEINAERFKTLIESTSSDISLSFTWGQGQHIDYIEVRKPSTYTSLTIWSYQAYLTKIVGIKYKTKQGSNGTGGNCDCEPYENDEIRNYVREAIGK